MADHVQVFHPLDGARSALAESNAVLLRDFSGISECVHAVLFASLVIAGRPADRKPYPAGESTGKQDQENFYSGFHSSSFFPWNYLPQKPPA